MYVIKDWISKQCIESEWVNKWNCWQETDEYEHGEKYILYAEKEKNSSKRLERERNERRNRLRNYENVRESLRGTEAKVFKKQKTTINEKLGNEQEKKNNEM